MVSATFHTGIPSLQEATRLGGVLAAHLWRAGQSAVLLCLPDKPSLEAAARALTEGDPHAFLPHQVLEGDAPAEVRDAASGDALAEAVGAGSAAALAHAQAGAAGATPGANPAAAPEEAPLDAPIVLTCRLQIDPRLLADRQALVLVAGPLPEYRMRYPALHYMAVDDGGELLQQSRDDYAQLRGLGAQLRHRRVRASRVGA